MTKVVVLEKFKRNWEIGSVVSVKDGYARNYLIPNGKARFATKLNIDEIKTIESKLLKKDEEVKSIADDKATSISKLKFVKEIANLGGNIDRFVTKSTAKELKNKF